MKCWTKSSGEGGGEGKKEKKEKKGEEEMSEKLQLLSRIRSDLAVGSSRG